MKEIQGCFNKILEIDLSKRTFKEFPVSEEDRELFLGGKGLGLKLLYDRLKPGIDPLGKDNIIAIIMGPMLGSGAPCSGRFAAVTKSPLTRIMISSSCGGSFGLAFKSMGYDGLLIRGAAAKPTILDISTDGVTFASAQQYWGKETGETQNLLALSKDEGALVIGPAGESKALFANVASGQRYLGRGGIGAVMGAKNLKAVVARGGNYNIVPVKPYKFAGLKKKALKYINNNEMTSVFYRKYGTSTNVKLSDEANILPVRNFTSGSSDKAGSISGERMREKYNSTYSTCKPCSILCGHKGTLNGRSYKVPEYETVGMMGANLGIFDPDRITEWHDLCGRLGLDTITTGATLAWIMEAGEKGLIETDLKFGTPKGVVETIESTAYRRGAGDEYANGSRWLAQKYGGTEFAMHVKGLELSAYDPRGSWGQGLSYAVANRGGCHLSGSIFAIEPFFKFLRPVSKLSKPYWVRYWENLYTANNSLQMCHFVTFAYIMEQPIIKYLPRILVRQLMMFTPRIAAFFIGQGLYYKFFEAVTGIKMSRTRFQRAGERIHTLERLMNTNEGIGRKDDTLPARLLTEPRNNDPKRLTVPLKAMLDKYYRLRGYSKNGIPEKKTLKKLHISISDKLKSDYDLELTISDQVV